MLEERRSPWRRSTVCDPRGTGGTNRRMEPGNVVAALASASGCADARGSRRPDGSLGRLLSCRIHAVLTTSARFVNRRGDTIQELARHWLALSAKLEYTTSNYNVNSYASLVATISRNILRGRFLRSARTLDSVLVDSGATQLSCLLPYRQSADGECNCLPRPRLSTRGLVQTRLFSQARLAGLRPVFFDLFYRMYGGLLRSS